MYEKRPTQFKCPDLSKLQAVVINHRTTIYIKLGADPEEARNRYFSRLGGNKS